MEITKVNPQDKHNERIAFQITIWEDNDGELWSTTMLVKEYVHQVCETIAGAAKHRDLFGNTMLEEISQVLTDKIMEDLR